MTDPFERPGHGPADPEGYLVEETPDGYRWTCRADGRTAEPVKSPGCFDQLAADSRVRM